VPDVLAPVPEVSPPLGLPPGDPTFAGFQWFVQVYMAVPPQAMPDITVLQACFDQAENLAYYGLQTIPSQPTSPSIYAFAVYNLAAAILAQVAMDDPNAPPPYNTYWANLQQQAGLNNFVAGLINSAADQGTSDGLYILPQLAGMTLFNLQLTKTPWGQQYLVFSGQWGMIWGLTI
jgi:hypothetical protein